MLSREIAVHPTVEIEPKNFTTSSVRTHSGRIENRYPEPRTV